MVVRFHNSGQVHLSSRSHHTIVLAVVVDAVVIILAVVVMKPL
jgi:hypothetical protein